MAKKKINDGIAIKNLRAREGLTQEEFAERIGVSPASVSKWERGANISGDSVKAIAEIFGLSMVDWADLGTPRSGQTVITEAPDGEPEEVDNTGSRSSEYDWSNAIRHLRKREGLTQVEFAKVVSASTTSISQWERGKNIHGIALDRICDAYNISRPQLAALSHGNWGPKSKHDPDHLEMLRNGVSVWNKWRKDNPEIRPNLEKVNLSNTKLATVDFSNTNLLGASLERADLIGANLKKADLSFATIKGADFQQAIVEGAIFFNVYGADNIVADEITKAKILVLVRAGGDGGVGDNGGDGGDGGDQGAPLSEGRKARMAEINCLDVEKYASVLSEHIRNTTGEFCFGLMGPWGRGKTHLMNLVSKHLSSNGEGDSYRTVKFSAWKFRTTPEVWVHLYETLRDAALKEEVPKPFVEGDSVGQKIERKLSWTRQAPLKARFGFERYGFWPLFWAASLFGLMLVPWGKVLGGVIDWLLTGGFGLGGLFLGYRVLKGASKAHDTLDGKYSKLADHREKLGLQAAMGEDIRALLMAWIPRYRGSARALGRRYWRESLALSAATFFAVFVFTCQLVWVFGKVVGVAVPLWVYIGTALLVGCGALFILYRVSTYCIERERGLDKVLLVVDDLDRCEVGQVLEIMECLVLMVDDPELADRIQLVMLVEDHALEHAILHKFDSLIAYKAKKLNGDTKSTDEGAKGEQRARDTVIREHTQKLFLTHLRLGPLADNEVDIIAKEYIKETRKGNNEEDVPDPGPKDPIPDDGGVVTPGPVKEPVEPIDQVGIEEGEEEEALLEIIKKSRSGSAPVEWGPRRIKSLLLTYQLARSILQELGEFDNDYKGLIKELDKQLIRREAATEDSVLGKVVQQVV